jgi:hypothetical protein
VAGLDLPDGEEVLLPLELRTERGRPAPPAPFEIHGRIAVGCPQVRLLTPADAGPDDELASFIRSQRSTWDYFLTTLSCTFVSADDERLATAWLRLSLAGPADSEDPIACSMDPLALEEIRALPIQIKLAVPCVISTEVAVQADRTRREVAVQALYEGTAHPAWTFAETATRRLHGVQRLRLVVRVPAGQAATGTLDVGATVRHRRLGTDAFPYYVPTPATEVLTVRFSR